jgi:hypothetical protein
LARTAALPQSPAALALCVGFAGDWRQCFVLTFLLFDRRCRRLYFSKFALENSPGFFVSQNSDFLLTASPFKSRISKRIGIIFGNFWGFSSLPFFVSPKIFRGGLFRFSIWQISLFIYFVVVSAGSSGYFLYFLSRSVDSFSFIFCRVGCLVGLFLLFSIQFGCLVLFIYSKSWRAVSFGFLLFLSRSAISFYLFIRSRVGCLVHQFFAQIEAEFSVSPEVYPPKFSLSAKQKHYPTIIIFYFFIVFYSW